MSKLKTIALGLSIFSISLLVSARPMEVYIPDWAVSYARQWVSNTQTLRNSSYISFNNDCTNFISQALRAGGWRNTSIGSASQDMYWYYISSSQYSQTWTVSNALYRHLANGYEEGWTGGKFLIEYPIGINYGDIIFADWDNNGTMDHSMIVTGFRRKPDGTLEPRLSYHSNDRKDISWSDFVAAATSSVLYKIPQVARYGKYPYPVTPLASQIF